MSKKKKTKKSEDLKIYIIGAPVKVLFRGGGASDEDLELSEKVVSRIIANAVEAAITDFCSYFEGNHSSSEVQAMVKSLRGKTRKT